MPPEGQASVLSKASPSVNVRTESTLDTHKGFCQRRSQHSKDTAIRTVARRRFLLFAPRKPCLVAYTAALPLGNPAAPAAAATVSRGPQQLHHASVCSRHTLSSRLGAATACTKTLAVTCSIAGAAASSMPCSSSRICSMTMTSPCSSTGSIYSHLSGTHACLASRTPRGRRLSTQHGCSTRRSGTQAA